jgi:DNA polymerase-3 subunit epsilon
MGIPSKLLLIDCETTGTDPEKDSLCEIGAILFSVQHKAVIQQISFLIPVESNPAEKVNGIAVDLTTSSSPESNDVMLTALSWMAHQADACVAHNADFDRQWVTGFLLEKPWICTCHGISWPNLRPSPSLASLALAYGVPVWAAHRALTDCIYLAQVFERDSQLEDHLEEGLLPQALVRACVTFDQKDLAKEAGFRWVPELKQWQRKCNERQIAALPFATKPINA